MTNTRAIFDPTKLKKKDWDHSAHILTAAHFCLKENAFYSALNKTKCFIIHFGAERGYTSEQCSTKYHETMTCFWVKLVSNYIKNNNIATIEEFQQRLNETSETFSKDIIYKHYSKEILDTDKARSTWIREE